MADNIDDAVDLFGESDDEQQVQPQQISTEKTLQVVKDEVEDLFESEDEESSLRPASMNVFDEAEEGDEEEEGKAEEGDEEIDVKKLAHRLAFARGSPKKVALQSIDKVKEDETLELFSLPNVVAIDDQEYRAEDGLERIEKFKNTLSETRARVTEGFRNVIRWRKRVHEDGTEEVCRRDI